MELKNVVALQFINHDLQMNIFYIILKIIIIATFLTSTLKLLINIIFSNINTR